MLPAELVDDVATGRVTLAALGTYALADVLGDPDRWHTPPLADPVADAFVVGVVELEGAGWADLDEHTATLREERRA